MFYKLNFKNLTWQIVILLSLDINCALAQLPVTDIDPEQLKQAKELVGNINKIDHEVNSNDSVNQFGLVNIPKPSESINAEANQLASQTKPKTADLNEANKIVSGAKQNQQFKDYEKEIKVIEPSANDIKEAKTLTNQVDKLKNTKKYQEYKNWIEGNKEKLFARQNEAIPTIDDKKSNSDIKNQNAIAEILQNYRFNPSQVKKSQIIYHPVMIFVSSSIPKETFKELMIQAKNSEAILVFRGMIGNLVQTSNFLAQISKENVTAIIDPRLFTIFKVETVPTFVVVADISKDCLTYDCKTTPLHDRITGNITLNYALEQIINQQGDSIKTASSYLTKLSKEPYEKLN